ncbi:recombination protein NinG [Xenorhabdus szentirmaii]|uniref:recombination protein NinG n=1 Tax=Xenorhabdus szentirmaii TaxID=290112 RepID=UPI001984382E|nr:recombination protein NinG [Xenorhabdus sp. 5]MBD2827082.1 recombination protein NinG [Xenorhabdus sp. 5]
MKKLRRRKCKICHEWFHPQYDNTEWCSPEHGAELALRRRKETEARDKLKARKLAVKPLSHFARQAQTAFNAFIRERDKYDPCISCGRFHEGQWHAGHYRTQGAYPELRFDEDNCHKQCSACNNYLSGNIDNYMPRLIEKIGQARFDRLMSHHALPKWKREDYEQIRDHYKERLRELRREAA